MRVGVASVWEDADYARVRNLCDGLDGWEEVYKKGSRAIYMQTIGTSSVTMFKARISWPDVSAQQLFDTLHDGDYRGKWDKHMTKSVDIGIINPNNDIGYYAIRSVTPIRPRDFVLQRSWLDAGKEKLLCSHSVCHDDYPPMAGHIRGTTFLSGYLIRENGKGCDLTYVTHTDPGGKIPKWLINRVSKVMAPKVLDKLYKAALGYPEWKAKNRPNWKPWRYPDQLVDAPRISLDKCEPRDYVQEVMDESGSEEENENESD
ncbi:hypothetical protein PRIPAC_92286 [Pristionchus pacificus]|uniref:START domain-containing protein 10 n=1 Tax=Pristionchus pacificus TaxID=54126 RepID=A0A2A6BQ81_PRIPA|nr:hypothetical protein PRIPAC_92286 [Pristionchus pacificus]|eukprot:PDM68079.1 hypothetical protein PRIPAC_46123 [Pristionchus pacificus]